MQWGFYLKNNEEYFKTNLRRWNELVEVNAKSKFYNLDGFKSGKSSLFPIELKEIGDVEGKTLLHLQCHFGMDTLSLARMGAKVTGIDFSDKAIALARQLSEELDVPANFINANIYDIPNLLEDKFDIVFTSNGVIGWLPDLFKWAEIIDYCLKPGGTFYIVENHPFGNLIDEKYEEAFQVGYDYFNEGKPYRFDEEMSYADPNYKVQNNTTIHPDMKQREDHYWEFQTFKYSVPMIFSIRAHKKND